MGAAPRLFRLDRLQSKTDGAGYSISSLTSPHQMRPKKKPVLFIHGAEYGSHDEVIQEMIRPFFAASGLGSREINDAYDIYFLSWHSDLICKKTNTPLEVANLRKSAFIDFLRGGRRWPDYFADVERRAIAASHYLEPYWSSMLARSKPHLPEIVTHSLGAYLFSHLIQNMAKKNSLPANLGSWLSLQPAVSCDAYQPGGQFDRVPEIYSHSGARKEVWMSRFDIVLGILYPMATKKGSLDLKSLPDYWHAKDLTWKVREAHGSVSFSPYISDFFSRISTSIRDRYASGTLNVANAHSI